ncbi:MAG TPA: peptidoglycan bridge formation glycyltransferase FemA/FemB family protein [Candidatus Dormibacteraeota bacterium]|nr:peptidoglycan bridge formation glycyltransferase FemA/FemB family protein [Candidatus Dormibacteraeota bacterium]
MREATAEELAKWNELVAANPDGGNVLQARAFGEVKSRHGWQAKHLVFENIAILALQREILGLGKFWYIPKGPGVKDTVQLQRLAAKLKKTDAFAVRIDPEIKKGGVVGSGFERAPHDIQYNIATVIVDLAPSEDEILASFKQKTRYNIRLAEKKGVKVETVETNPESIKQMYSLMQSTQRRAGFYLRDKAYFTDFWQLHANSGTGQMFFASYEGKVLAGAFVTYLGSAALYKDGGSVREHSELQAPYLLQWEITKWLKARSVKEYDLHGTPPADQIDNPNHPLSGLARFKTGFNPSISEFIGTYDLVLNTASYRLWRAFGERLAAAYEIRAKKRLFY